MNSIIKKEWLSHKQQQWLNNKKELEEYKETNISKLILTLHNKIGYTCNYRYLQLCLKQGMKLIKVNKVLEYEQKPFLKPYIELNTSLRTKAKNDFEKDFFKLMNNAVYGKTMENVRNRINFKLVNNKEKLLRYNHKPTFKHAVIFSENLVGLHMLKKNSH